MKWYTKIQYVDLQTGEILDKKTVEEKYTVIKTQKNYEYESEYGKNRTVRTITKLCTNEGKQGKLFNS